MPRTARFHALAGGVIIRSSVDEAGCLAASTVDRDVEDVGAAVVPGGIEVLPRRPYRLRVDVGHEEPFLVGDRLGEPAAVRCGYGRATSAEMGHARLFKSRSQREVSRDVVE